MYPPSLPEPEIIGCVFTDGYHASQSVMQLHWRGAAGTEQRHRWQLPQGLSLTGPLPASFGFSILRHDLDAYDLQISWDHMSLAWSALSRREIEGTSLGTLLAALDTDLQYMLDQPILPTAVHCSAQTVAVREAA